MNFEPSKFTLSKPPLAVVLAQFGLQYPISDSTLNNMRSSLRRAGLERLTKRRDRTVSFSPPSIEPKVQDLEVSILVDSKNSKGVSVAGNTISCFTGRHSNFTDFIQYLSQVVASISGGGGTFEATSVALRYINVFEIGDDPATVVKQSLRGLERFNLGKEHHHHNYEFWCDTDQGRLTLRFSTTHGDRKPAQIGHADVVFPHDRLTSYDVMVGHLDIFANTNALSPPSNWEASKGILQRMNLDIEQAFLNAIDESALVNKFGAERTESS